MQRLIAFSDVHFPQHDPEALEVLGKTLKHYKPDLAISCGDLLDCKAFSTHAPDSMDPDTPFDHDIKLANDFLDTVQKSCKKLVLVEGNHEHRIARYAARERPGKAAHSLLSPEVLLTKGRKNCVYVPYENTAGGYSHYRITPNLAAVHGWSASQNATKEHLKKAQGVSIIHGHTHRAEHQRIQDPWSGFTIEAVSCGCLCNQIPTYKPGTPREWVQGFVLGFIGNQIGHTLYFVPVNKGRCVLPDGKEIKC